MTKLEFKIKIILSHQKVLFLDNLDSIIEKYESIKPYLGNMNREEYDEIFGNKNK